jgi:TrmH family RNA methyltransferase
MNAQITSKQNPAIKNIVQLQKHKERELQQLILVEGLKEIAQADAAKYVIEEVYFCPQITSEQTVAALLNNNSKTKQITVSAEVFEKIAYRESTGGVVALARPKTHSFSSLQLPENPLILVLEGVEKPGNMGAIYRTADAAGVDAIIVSDPLSDIYNPNAIRASLGCVFSVPTVICSGEEAIKWLKDRGIQIFCTWLQAAVGYHTVDYRGPSAIVMGTEADGISRQWVKAARQNIIIPMRGRADSMNVSTSTAVVVFEAMRQRGFGMSQ